jgi:multisubunit Na+/H+ antiporter MnhG subunit
MRRKSFDAIVSAGGLLLAVVLVAAGLLAFWGYSYANNTVSSQLAAQKITFPTQAQLDQAKNPPKGGFSEITPAMVPYLAPYAGQLMTTGAQAEAYANHFIAIHLQEMTGGQTYSQVSAEAMALSPTSKAGIAANATVETVFKGTTLRSMLLNAYGWWQMGQIAMIASIAMFILAATTVLLSALGLWHFRRVPAEEEIPRLAGAALFTSTGGSAPISAVSPS